jgi:hypothetical protein
LDDLTTHTSLSPPIVPGFVIYKKGAFGYSASSTTKTGRHDIADILLKVALSIINQNQISFRVRSLILKIPPSQINKKKSPKTTVKLSKKRAETSVVLIVFDYVESALISINAVTVSYRRST